MQLICLFRPFFTQIETVALTVLDLDITGVGMRKKLDRFAVPCFKIAQIRRIQTQPLAR